jgi:hypothetical protein
MDRTVPTPSGSAQGDSSTDAGPGPNACPPQTPQGGPPLIIAKTFAQTVRHFFPELNDWLQALPDTRDRDAITYETRFLAWWGLLLFVLQLGSRRQLDFALDRYGRTLLDNLNRLASSSQSTLPVHDTLDHFLEHVPSDAFADLRFQMVRRLIRMKVLDDARLLGHYAIVIDGTGLFTFHERHCDTCLERKTRNGTLYLHQVLEAKLLGPAGLVISLGSEFIENSDAAASQSADPEQLKQDCELKAFTRLAARIKSDYPQLRVVVVGDALFACGTFFQIVKDNNWSYVVTFKEGRLPTAWSEFQQLMPLCPENERIWQLPDGTRQVFRWVSQLSHTDDCKRTWSLNGLQCEQTSPAGEVQRFAWLTPLPVEPSTVQEIAEKGGRARWKIENEGFNRQKNSGLNLEHVYSHDPEKWKAYYYLLQIAFIITQLVERGSLLQQLAAQLKRTPLQLFGSLANMARYLLNALSYFDWPEDCFDETAARSRRIHFDSS